MFETDAALAWPAMPYRAPVYAADASEIGSAESLLGDEEADIFHGIVVKRREDVSALEPYREERWYHIGWGGLFRKHPEWDRTTER